MKRILLFVVISLSALFANGQLDQVYYGTYFNEDATKAFTIYFVDELSEHCFLVDYETMSFEGESNIESGYGYCDENDGSKAFFYIESIVNPVNVQFSFDEFGLLYMSVYFPNEANEELFYFQGDIYEEEDQEILFERVDGTQLVLFPTENDEVGFSVLGLLSEACEGNELTGVLVATDESMTSFIYTDELGCELNVSFYDQGAIVTEKDCEQYRGEKCIDWAGTYYYAE